MRKADLVVSVSEKTGVPKVDVLVISLTLEAFVSQPTYIVRSNKTDKNKTRY